MKATKTNMPIKTLQVRVRDRRAALLSRMAFEANQVWNLANEASYEAWHVPVPEVGYIQGVWRSAFADLPEVKTAVAASIGGEQMALF
ncbi:hypothetical protein [Thiolapillus sp.]|uniref:hypothetical protein n=1 Tax=Thiolapillus sp. TaxID=2017437 RepID=UPI003AF47FDD